MPEKNSPWEMRWSSGKSEWKQQKNISKNTEFLAFSNNKKNKEKDFLMNFSIFFHIHNCLMDDSKLKLKWVFFCVVMLNQKMNMKCIW